MRKVYNVVQAEREEREVTSFILIKIVVEVLTARLGTLRALEAKMAKYSAESVKENVANVSYLPAVIESSQPCGVKKDKHKHRLFVMISNLVRWTEGWKKREDIVPNNATDGLKRRKPAHQRMRPRQVDRRVTTAEEENMKSPRKKDNNRRRDYSSDYNGFCTSDYDYLKPKSRREMLERTKGIKGKGL